MQGSGLDGGSDIHFGDLGNLFLLGGRPMLCVCLGRGMSSVTGASQELEGHYVESKSLFGNSCSFDLPMLRQQIISLSAGVNPLSCVNHNHVSI